MCLPSDAFLQHLLSYLSFSFLGRGESLHSCSSKAQPLLLTLDEGYLLNAALPDLQCGIALLGPPAPTMSPGNSSGLGRGLLLPAIISPKYSLEGPVLKLQLRYFGHLMQRTDSLEKTLMLGRQEKGTTEDEMVAWHHQLDGLEFELAPGVGNGQGCLACCSPWGRKESDVTERLK